MSHTLNALRQLGRLGAAVALLVLPIATVSAVAGPAAPASACTGGAAQYSLWGDAPAFYYGTYPNLWSYGEGDYFPSPPCGSPQETDFQTKVCGFWGCSWETWAQTGPTYPNSNAYGQWVSHGCRSGLNRYQTQVILYNVGGPGYNAWWTSSQPEYSC